MVSQEVRVEEQETVFETVEYPAECQDCGGVLECHGIQALVGGRLRWDVESACSACGFAVAVCDGELPDERREQLLSAHGPAWLRVTAVRPGNVLVMRILRDELGVGLAAAKAALHGVLSGEHTGTLPEMELLARQLRASGIAAVAARRP